MSLQATHDFHSQFISKISHDIRSYVHITLGMVSLIKSSPNLHLEERLGLIEESCNHTKLLLEDILLIGKHHHSSPLQYESVLLSDIISYLEGMMSVVLQGIFVTFSIESQCHHDAYIHTHRLSLYRILINLLSNAAKYTDSSRIIFSLSLKKEGYLFRVYGCGADRKPSHALHNETESYGLGLMICKELVALLGGTLTVDQDYGATVVLPVSKPH
jgi:signal transduction histidine kinase